MGSPGIETQKGERSKPGDSPREKDSDLCASVVNPENGLVDVKKDTKKDAKPEEIETLNDNLIDKTVDVTNPTNTTNTVKHTCINFENLVSATTVAGYRKPKGNPPPRGEEYSILPVLSARTWDKKGRPMNVRVLLDSASTTSFVSVSASNRMRLVGDKRDVRVELNTLGGTKMVDTEEVDFNLYHPDKAIRKTLRFTAVVTERIFETKYCDEHPDPVVRARMRKLELNEGFPRPAGSVDILLGVSAVFRVFKGIKEKVGRDFYVLNTVFGLVPCGRNGDVATRESAVFVTNLERLNASVERMLKAEELPLDNILGSMTRDEVLAVQKVEEKLKRDQKTGRFVTGLMWRDKPQLRNNYKSARARFETLMRKLRRNTELRKAYTEAVEEFIKAKVAEEVQGETPEELQDPNREDRFYLPHREVFDPERATTKCRVVFDASAKSGNGKSLNDCLLAGPALQQNIAAVELRFRTRKVALVGDCQKMFLQIGVEVQDRDYLRFLWKDPMDTQAEPKVYRFTTLAFGTTDAPFLAISSLQRLVKDKMADPNITEVEKLVCSTIKRDTYVDDITTGGKDVNEALAVYKGMTSMLGSAGFKIRKWATNSKELLQQIPAEERAPTKEIIERAGPTTISEATSLLGVRWDPQTDDIVYDCYGKIHEKNDDTKTAVASLLATPFDPLGGLAPFVLLARRVMKETHVLGLGWKDKIPEPLMPEWHDWVEMTKRLSQVRYPRYVLNNDRSEYHIFGDASATMGYGVVVYVRTPLNPVKENGKYHSQFLYAKSKINPKKELTVPRLELTAALLCTEVGQMIQNELEVPQEKIFCWSDSEITLWWIKKRPEMLIPFVANRVEKIQHSGYPFSYINTKENSANIASRGCTPEELMGDLWQKGPPFLQLPRKDWPDPKIDFTKIDPFEGIKKQHVYVYHTLAYPQKLNEGNVEFHSYFGDHRTLLRRTAALLLCADIWRRKVKGEKIEGEKALTFNMVNLMLKIPEARRYWIKDAQRKSFSQEIHRLEQGKEILPESNIRMYNPRLDAQGVLRVHGRIGESSVSTSTKRPVLLPKDHGFTRTLVKMVHEENHHAAVDWCHFHIRQGYWIISSRQLIRKDAEEMF